MLGWRLYPVGCPSRHDPCAVSPRPFHFPTRSYLIVTTSLGYTCLPMDVRWQVVHLSHIRAVFEARVMLCRYRLLETSATVGAGARLLFCQLHVLDLVVLDTSSLSPISKSCLQRTVS